MPYIEGSPGDRTEHVLFRLENDEYIDAVKAANLVVIMIGTNNVVSDHKKNMKKSEFL